MSNLIFKANPTPAAVYVPSLLTTMAIAQFASSGTIHDQVFPYCPVDDLTGYYTKFNKGDIGRAITEARSGGSYAEIDFDIDNSGTFAIKTFGAKKRYNRMVANAWKVPITRDMSAVQLLTRAVKMRREKNFLANCFVTGVWATDKTGGTDFTQWSDPGSDPIGDVKAWKTQVMLTSQGYPPNVLALGQYAYDALIQHPDIIDRIGTGAMNGDNPRTANLLTLARIFEVEKVVVGNIVEETAAKGATSAPGFVAGKHALLVHVTSTPSIEIPSAGYTFTWMALGASAQGINIRQGTNTEDDYDWYTVDHGEDFKIVASDLGLFAYNVVA